MQSIEECHEECFQPDGAASGPDSSRVASLNELRERILKALKNVPHEKRVVIILSYFEQLTFREIGQTLGIPEHTVKNRFYRGLNALRGELKSLGVFEADCFHET